MRHKSGTQGSGSEKLIRTIKRKSLRQYIAEEKIQIIEKLYNGGYSGEEISKEMNLSWAMIFRTLKNLREIEASI